MCASIPLLLIATFHLTASFLGVGGRCNTDLLFLGYRSRSTYCHGQLQQIQAQLLQVGAEHLIIFHHWLIDWSTLIDCLTGQSWLISFDWSESIISQSLSITPLIDYDRRFRFVSFSSPTAGLQILILLFGGKYHHLSFAFCTNLSLTSIYFTNYSSSSFT